MVKEEIVSIFKRLWPDLDITDLETDGGMQGIEIDSVEFITLIVEIEKQFGIEFEDEHLDLETFDNLQSVCDYVQLKVDALS